jgi:hypothetical protein
MQGGLIPFEIGVSVVGDVTIAVWLGSHNMGERIHARPSFAYAFHTGGRSGLLVRRTVIEICCSMDSCTLCITGVHSPMCESEVSNTWFCSICE